MVHLLKHVNVTKIITAGTRQRNVLDEVFNILL